MIDHQTFKSEQQAAHRGGSEWLGVAITTIAFVAGTVAIIALGVAGGMEINRALHPIDYLSVDNPPVILP